MVAEEHYIFSPGTKKNIIILLVVGVALFILGLVMAMNGGGHEAEGAHSSLNVSTQLVASADQGAASDGHEVAANEHHGSPIWLKRVYTTLWTNNIYFLGLGLIGLFFVALQYASAAGWSAGFVRIPLAMGQWIPIAGILTLVLWFVVKADVFHWSHHDLYVEGGAGFDEIINGKAPYFYWPGPAGGFPIFFILRMVVFFGLWYYFFTKIKKNMLAEDLDASPSYYFKNRGISAWFLVFFGASSSIAAWDWVMSIDTHWFSTMLGWYVFSSWWVTALAFITLMVVYLKEKGYLQIVNANHLHDLGKFVFAFTIFWTYIWFSQFLLIYYANIPEETVYFIQRMSTSQYAWVFYLNLILNFVLPFLMFMTRDSKRQMSMLKVVCLIVVVGHWFDFYNMVTPGVMKLDGELGFLEIGMTCIFFAAFLYVTLASLAKVPLVGRNHPLLEESLHHHI